MSRERATLDRPVFDYLANLNFPSLYKCPDCGKLLAKTEGHTCPTLQGDSQ